MKLDLLNIENKKTDVQISETTFGKEFNETLVHQAVVTYLAGSRQGSHKQKTRSEVRGDHGNKNRSPITNIKQYRKKRELDQITPKSTNSDLRSTHQTKQDEEA
jgi:ribosomal protein L4